MPRKCTSWYQSYLQSPEWKAIRKQVFGDKGRSCRCGRKATQVHHSDYAAQTMSGEDISGLVPICSKCHEKIHRGGKSLRAANQRLNSIKRSRSKSRGSSRRKSQKSVCSSCHRMLHLKRAGMCSRCWMQNSTRECPVCKAEKPRKLNVCTYCSKRLGVAGLAARSLGPV